MPATAIHPADLSLDRRCPRRARFAAFGAVALVAAVLIPPGVSGAATAVGLGTAGSFAVLGAQTVTNTGPSFLDGDVGVHPGNALTGFEDSDGGPGIVTGSLHAGDETAERAQADAQTAYGALAEQGCDVDLTGQDLGGLTLVPGVYCFDTSAQLTGTVTLNAVGNPDSVFVFRVGSMLTTASSSSVEFTDDFATCGVFWQVGSAATLGTDTDFVGTLITQTEAITANTRATVSGRLLALNAAVTLDSNVITAPSCPPPSDETPVEGTPVDDTPVAETPVDETPVDDTPVDDTPVDDTPVDDTPVDDAPVDDAPLDETPVDDTLLDDTPVDDAGGDATRENATTPGTPSLTDAPITPVATGSPAVPVATDGPGPVGPRPPLAATGAHVGMLTTIGLLSVMGGFALVAASRRPVAPGHRSTFGRTQR